MSWLASFIAPVFPILVAMPQASPRADDPPPPQEPPPHAVAPQKPPAAQDEPPALPPVYVTAFRRQQDLYELPRSITWVDEEEMRRRDQASALDSLNRSIGVWVEKRTATTSDPVVRGLSGANLLALVDGNPMTTFWGEGGFAGDDLYGKIEAESLERIEVIRGPASVLYGANALGGVIHFHSRRPRLEFPDQGIRFGGRFKTSYNTINQGKMVRGDVEAAIPDFRIRAGGTWRDLSDGQGGHEVSTLKPSGGEDLNFDFNSELRLAEDGEALLVSMQQVWRRDIARYYRPTQRNENDRTGVTLGYRSAAESAEQALEGRVYYQWKEDRRDFGNGSMGYAQWKTLSTDWTLRSRSLLPGHSFIGGLTLRLDQGESPDDEQFTIVTPSGDRQKAAPDQDWWNLGLFLEDEWELTPWLVLSAGIRYDRFLYNSRPDQFYQPPVGDPELDRIRDWTHSVTGGIGLVAKVDEEWRFLGSWTRGFRSFAPKFGITKHAYGVIVPTGLLEPVTGDSFELGVRHRSAGVESSLVGYYTDFDNFQNIVPGSFQGQDYYDWNGNNVLEPDERVYVTVGNGDAYVYGVEWEARIRPSHFIEALPDGLWLGGGIMWNYGNDETNHEPLRHTHPARGLVTIGYEEPAEGRWWVELTADIVDSFTRIAGSRLRSDVGYRKDPQDPTSPLLRDGGLPGYTVYDLRAGLKLHEQVRIGLNIENLTNKNYRAAHSRMDGFGTTARFFVELTF